MDEYRPQSGWCSCSQSFSEQSLKLQSHQHTNQNPLCSAWSQRISYLCTMRSVLGIYKMCKANLKVRKIPDCLLAVVVVPPWKMFLWLLYISPSSISISVSILFCPNNMFLLLSSGCCCYVISPFLLLELPGSNMATSLMMTSECVCFCVSLWTTECASLCICCVESKWLCGVWENSCKHHGSEFVLLYFWC